ncbi:hypothetical protein [Herbaspirillum autotrophicum]|uniref:hypothetical protein n=1 Tax=Herbaspirillum autotrophicum TaxID=180195 RepID=UPI00067B9905|nr:hypothetical protein [Herbaspirillum autotrophicum]
MWNINYLKAAIPLSIAVGAVTVMACGPDFPMQLLDDRAGTLNSTPNNSFAFEVANLVSVPKGLTANETGLYENPEVPGGLEAPEKSGLTAAQAAQLKTMRALTDGDAAWALGAEVPAAVRLYTAGAVDYLASRAGTADADPRIAAKIAQEQRAQQRFQAVLDLPPQEGNARAVWAAYMLGQVHAQAMSAAGMQPLAERAKAERFYQLARTRAAAGASDPAGLAVASLGEQARLYFVSGDKLCAYADFTTPDTSAAATTVASTCADGIASADLKQAIHLYAQQAAYHSNSGMQSLRVMAEWALSNPARAARLIDDPVAQQLLVAYGLARVGDIVNDDPSTAADYYSSVDYGAKGYADAARGGSNIKINPMLQTLVTALQVRGLNNVSGSDRVAALAYRIGRYDLAQTLIDKQNSALSYWVRAKLALRKGDVNAAAQAYATASKAFPQTDASLEPAGMTLLKAEQGVLMLSRGQYVDAFDQLYKANAASRDQQGASDIYGDYSGDMYYIAERVLTTDELKTYIDSHVPASATPPLPAGFPDVDQQTAEAWRQKYAAEPGDRLRQLLARRLVREGRIKNALAYFPDDKDLRYAEITDISGKTAWMTWRLRQLAKDYGDALHDGQHAWRAATRAQAMYQAAVLAREHGMEIMGYQQGPDFFEYGGMLGYGSGRSSQRLSAADTDANAAPVKPADTPQARALAELPGALVTADERVRYAASEARPNRRFHYRDIAFDHFMAAADQLPPRSQAFAAVLCKGAGYLMYDADAMSALYRRYVKQGAAVPFTANFGQQCADPDFSAAARFPYVQAWKQTRRWLSVHRHAVSAAALLALALAGVGIWRWRRRRTPAP